MIMSTKRGRQNKQKEIQHANTLTNYFSLNKSPEHMIKYIIPTLLDDLEYDEDYTQSKSQKNRLAPAGKQMAINYVFF